MKKTYITPSVKIHQLKAKKGLLAGSIEPNTMRLRNDETNEQW